jgi:hypothetical protein
MDALQRLPVLVHDKVRSSEMIAKDVVFAMIDSIMGAAIEFMQSSRHLILNTVLTSMG